MNTYSKTTSEFHEHTFEAANKDSSEKRSNNKHSVATSNVRLKKGTAATRLAARKRSAIKKRQAKEHVTR